MESGEWSGSHVIIKPNLVSQKTTVLMAMELMKVEPLSTKWNCFFTYFLKNLKTSRGNHKRVKPEAYRLVSMGIQYFTYSSTTRVHVNTGSMLTECRDIQILATIA